MIAAAKTKVEPGIYRSMPDHEYRAIDALSNSDLMAWAKGDDADSIDQQVADLGSAFHAIIGEPEVAAQKIVRLEPKQRWKDHQQEGMWVITYSKYETLHGCYKSFMDHPECGKVAEYARENRDKCEVVIVWVDERTGLLCKMKLDLHTDDWLYDHKTTQKGPDDFIRAVASYGYDCQAAHYLAGAMSAGLRPKGMRFTCASKRKDWGYPCWITEISDEKNIEWLIAGQKQRERLMGLYAKFGGAA